MLWPSSQSGGQHGRNFNKPRFCADSDFTETMTKLHNGHLRCADAAWYMSCPSTQSGSRGRHGANLKNPH